MKYYTIQNNTILISNSENALTRYYDSVKELPDDYENDKYIIGEKEIEVDVPEYDEEGNPIIIEYEDKEVVINYDENGNPVGSQEIGTIKHKQQTHKEKITVKDIILNPNWQNEQDEKETVRIANLHMTRGDVFRGLLLAKGITRADIRGLIEAMPEEIPEQKIQKELALIDFEEALNFYRGVSFVDIVGKQLGITEAQMNNFFDKKDWHELIREEQK